MSTNSVECHPFRLELTPACFGRVNLDFEPIATSGWKLEVQLEPAKRPQSVKVPLSIAGRRFDRVLGANSRNENDKVMIDPTREKWTAFGV